MKAIAEKLVELELLLSEKRDIEDSQELCEIHRLVSEAASIASIYDKVPGLTNATSDGELIEEIINNIFLFNQSY